MKSWYVVHRPQLVEELDQEAVRTNISSFIKQGHFPQALLFAGPKGTGKTSTARIVAKILNCERLEKKLDEPCNECSSCMAISNGTSMAVVELDGASHRGIEDVRAIREAVKLLPASGRTKVYIIDEAHMLTTEAFNALLKTLEEPPGHVVFILATTELYRVPQTIQSRSTIIQFGKATKKELLRSLTRVVEREKLKVGEGVLDLVSQFSEGSFRDGIKFLEQLAIDKKITNKEAEEFFTQTLASPTNFLNLLANRDTKGSLEEISRLVKLGVNIRPFTVGLIEMLRKELLAKLGVDSSYLSEMNLQVDEIKQLIKILIEVVEIMRISPIPELPLELAVLEWSGGGKEVSQPPQRSTKLEVRSEKLDKDIPPQTSISDDLWRKLLAGIKTHNHSVAALLRSAKPLDFGEHILTISVFYQFHKERLEEEQNRRIVEEVAAAVLGNIPLRVVFILGERPSEQNKFSAGQAQQKAGDEDLSVEVPQSEKEEDIVKVAEEIFGAEAKN